MRHQSSSSVGAFHPTIFSMVIYAIAIVLTFLVYRMVINSINSDSNERILPNRAQILK